MVRLMKWMLYMILSATTSALAIKNAKNGSEPEMKDEDKSKRKDDEDLLETTSSAYGNVSTNSSIANKTCEVENSAGSFPADFMTQEQRKHGGIIFHILIGIYASYAIAAVCDSYFVPSLEIITAKLNMPTDVAGATLMAAGTSSPELFESIIGVFITEGDLGVGTIVGSALFNILAVTAICGLLAGMVVPLEWYPLSRDCIFYILTVVSLLLIIDDEKVYWYESLALLGIFVLYVLIMYFNSRLEKLAKSLIRKIRENSKSDGGKNKSQSSEVHANGAMNDGYIGDKNKEEIQETSIATIDVIAMNARNSSNIHSNHHEQGTTKNGEANSGYQKEEEISMECQPNGSNTTEIPATFTMETTEKNDDDDEEDWAPLTPSRGGFVKKCLWILTWPVNFLFFMTIPNTKSERWKKFYPFTFLISIAYIGGFCYIVAWMVSIFGETVGVPDTVMGITLLAMGTSVPEGFSSLIVCWKGHGNMAISNSVGSNAFDILICLGLPWLIKGAFLADNDGHYVRIYSGGIVYSTGFLLASVFVMYGAIAICGFKMNKKTGATSLIAYASFITLASLVEMNVFGPVNPQACS